MKTKPDNLNLKSFLIQNKSNGFKRQEIKGLVTSFEIVMDEDANRQVGSLQPFRTMEGFHKDYVYASPDSWVKVRKEREHIENMVEKKKANNPHYLNLSKSLNEKFNFEHTWQ